MDVLEVGIIGLGKFGYALAESLLEMGHRVVGLDNNESAVRSAQGLLTRVYQGDATDKQVLTQLGFPDLKMIMVSVGESMEASILITLALQELEAGTVWVKAVSEGHEKVLRKLGADLVVFPERFMARQLAQRLSVPGLLDYLPMGKGVALREVSVEAWDGKSLRDLDLANRFRVQVVAIKPTGEKDFNFVPRSDKPLRSGDTLLVMGRVTDIEEMK